VAQAKQRVPPVLATLDDPMDLDDKAFEMTGTRGCAYCGGLGHRITQCPQLEKHKQTEVCVGVCSFKFPVSRWS
jgi:ATP-dependent RNA helicase DDX41